MRTIFMQRPALLRGVLNLIVDVALAALVLFLVYGIYQFGLELADAIRCCVSIDNK
jgi:hypothetical protein